jgi:hypothetical protein
MILLLVLRLKAELIARWARAPEAKVADLPGGGSPVRRQLLFPRSGFLIVAHQSPHCLPTASLCQGGV